MKQKKVFHIITRLDMGGSAENAVISCKCIDRNKFEPVLNYGSSSYACAETAFRSIEIPELVRNISPFNDIRAFFVLFAKLRSESPDIVHTHSSKAGLVGRWAAWSYNLFLTLTGNGSRRARIIHTPHGHVFYGYEFGRLKAGIFLNLERLTAHITDHLVALTNGEMKESLAFGVGRPEQWVVIHSAVECPDGANCKLPADTRASLGIPADAVVVGTVARLDPVKGVGVLVEAAPIIAHACPSIPIWFLIVGGGTQQAKLESRAKKLGIHGRMVFTGMRRDIGVLMKSMDIYVQPSLNEGMGKTIIQAQHAGLPVVASRVQGIPDVVNEGKNGLLVPPADPAALASAVSGLVCDPEQRRCYSAEAKRWVSEAVDGCSRFGEKRMIQLLEQLYER